MMARSYLTRLKRQILSHVVLVRWILGFTAILAIIAVCLGIRQPVWSVSRIFSPGIIDQLPGNAGRVNFLVLGIGGGNHEGSDLTDSLILVSVNIVSGDTLLLTIPRDIWVNSLKAKINTAYHYGDQRQSGGGLILAKASVSEVVSQPVHFAVVIDFTTFTRAIDTLGGIDVDVENTFDDYLYPIAGKENDLCGGDPQYRCRYEHIRFERGLRHFDGLTALKFVRSRHSTDLNEGSDFARSRRQERIISAISKKLFSVETLKQPRIYQDLKNLLQRSVKTDITPNYYYSLFKLGLKAKSLPFRSAALSEPAQLYHPTVPGDYGHQWVLLPKADLAASVSAWLPLK